MLSRIVWPPPGGSSIVASFLILRSGPAGADQRRRDIAGCFCPLSWHPCVLRDSESFSAPLGRPSRAHKSFNEALGPPRGGGAAPRRAARNGAVDGFRRGRPMSAMAAPRALPRAWSTPRRRWWHKALPAAVGLLLPRVSGVSRRILSARLGVESAAGHLLAGNVGIYPSMARVMASRGPISELVFVGDIRGDSPKHAVSLVAGAIVLGLMGLTGYSQAGAQYRRHRYRTAPNRTLHPCCIADCHQPPSNSQLDGTLAQP